jgi:tetratricopeptide (TPR) repeat protein
MSDQQFSSEGFDLDALAAAAGTTKGVESAAVSEDIVYEIGGGISALPVESPLVDPAVAPDETSVTAVADDYKAQGNAAFRLQHWLEAADLYTQAVRALPGGATAADDLLQARDDWQAAQHALVRQKLAEEDAQRRQRKDAGEDEDAKDKTPDAPPERFRAPPHPHSSRLAIFHANRSAAYMQLEEYEAALKDCDVAILWNPAYTKVYLRRATLHEKLERIDEALADTKAALLLDPGNRQIRAAVDRLQKMENERLEKLKEETMVSVKKCCAPDIGLTGHISDNSIVLQDKLKDLGNSILGNFGLSMDNFKAVQDPGSGSYSISFNQNA